MKFTNIKPKADGTLSFDVEASTLEVSWLVNHAVENLLQEGVLAINNHPETQEVQLRETSH